MEVIQNLLAGLVIGVANIIPGVSGGTMMVVLNKFDKILGAVSDFRKDKKKNAWFLFQILLGAGIGVVVFSKIITFMLSNYSVITNFFFLGLIIGSVPLVYRSAFPEKQENPDGKKIVNVSSVVTAVICFAVLVVMAFFPASETTAAEPGIVDFAMGLKLFFGGMLSAVAMIIPGVSGSFVMVLLGIYPLVAGAAAVVFPVDADKWLHILVPIGIPAGLGILAGLLIGSKLIHWLLHRFPKQTYFGILGLLLGSLFDIYPGFLWNWQGLVAVLAAIFGFFLAFLSSSETVKNYFSKKRNA